MKFLLTSLIIVCSSLGLFAQVSPNEKRIKEIPSEIQQALKEEKYEKAAELKREKELRISMQDALKKEDYATAADLKKQIEQGGDETSSKVAELEKEMQAAVDREDYKRASDIKKQIEAIKSGNDPMAQQQATIATTPTYSGTVPTPDFVNQVFLWSRNGELQSLEKVEGKLTTSGGGFVVASATSSYTLPGPKSATRLTNDELRFIVKVIPGTDPSESIKFLKLDVRGRRNPSRFADQFKTTAAMYHSETGEVTNQYIEVNFKKLTDDVFEIVVPNLSSGEYAFMYITKFYAFGIN